MQTFLPFESFTESARVLDRQRLGKQRVETMQIMIALLEGRGWVNHPAVKMWAGYEWSLLTYQHAICAEWKSRGYRDTCWEKTDDIYGDYQPLNNTAIPPWLGDSEFHLAHQSNLLRKDPWHYGPYFPDVPDDLPYIWPVIA